MQQPVQKAALPSPRLPHKTDETDRTINRRDSADSFRNYLYFPVRSYANELQWSPFRISLIVSFIDFAIVGLGLLELHCELLFTLSWIAIGVPFCIDY